MTAPLVVKLGGGVARLGGAPLLRSLGTVLSAVAAARPLLVVPGGWEFADAVRAAADRLSLPDRTAHRLALLAMEQYGGVLATVIPGSVLTRRLDGLDGGPARVLLPGDLADEPALPASWSVTSDSIAAWVAARVGAPSAVLVKPVAVLAAERRGGVHVLDAAALERLQRTGGGSVVDAWLPTALRRFGVEAWLVDGREPGRVAAVLEGRAEPATRITPG